MPRQPSENARIPFAFTADGAYPAGTRMKMSATFGQLTAAGDEQHLGTLIQRTKAAGDPAPLYHANGAGTFAYVASGAIAKGAKTSSTTAGKIQTGETGAINLGYALDEAFADGDSIEVLPNS